MHDNAEKDTQNIYNYYNPSEVYYFIALFALIALILDVNFTVKLYKNKK